MGLNVADKLLCTQKGRKSFEKKRGTWTELNFKRIKGDKGIQKTGVSYRKVSSNK